jgi:serine/threonine protein kinase
MDRVIPSAAVVGASLPVQAGDILAGKYRVERVLGVGGMGVVVAAMHMQLERRVALKFMLPEVLGDGAALERFQREARAAARLRSEHVARILDVGLLDTGSPYMVMEYLEGSDLAAILRSQGPLEVPVIADYVTQALDAVAEAHAVGIIHRDLKPSNFFVTRRADGSALMKVLDFGISKAANPAVGDLSLTETRALVGSPPYMAPEQLRSNKIVDVRTDIWSLGVTLYQLVSGRLPFSAETYSALVLQVVMDEPAPLVPPRPIPAAFDALVWRCLAKDPALRFQNVAQLAEALAPFAPASARHTVERIHNLIGQGKSAGPAPEPAPPTPTPARAARFLSHRPLAVLLVVVAIGTLTGLVLALLREGPSPAPASPAPETIAPPSPDRDPSPTPTPPPVPSAEAVTPASPDAGASPATSQGEAPTRKKPRRAGKPRPPDVDDPLATPE